MAQRIVLDTNVLVAALRSSQGASFRILKLIPERMFEIALSVPLLFEYEDVLGRLVEDGYTSSPDVDALLHYLCTVGHKQSIFFLWRPLLPDPKDDMVLELAVAAVCPRIVTHNAADFAGAEKFGVEVISPGKFLKTLEVNP